jgi:hypothetical protein
MPKEFGGSSVCDTAGGLITADVSHSAGGGSGRLIQSGGSESARLVGCALFSRVFGRLEQLAPLSAV